MTRLDHIAIGCITLAEGAEYVRARTGLGIPAGGEHPLMGTHNLLMATGPDNFLEVIAINPDAPAPPHPRWFGLDTADFTSHPRPHAWILNSDDLATARACGINLGTPRTVTRGSLTWRFAVRDDGTIPLDGAAPMLMQWPNMPAHPAAAMTNFGARLKSINLHTPHAAILNHLLGKLADGPMPGAIHPSPDTRLAVTLTLKDGREAVLD